MLPDLSKVEAGQLVIHLEEERSHIILKSLRNTFYSIAKSNNNELIIQNDFELKVFETDQMRCEQILKNFR